MNNSYQNIAIFIANLVSQKNEAYGSSFSKSQQFLEILYPNGIAVSQYKDMLTIARIFDKLMRIANRKDAFGESPYGDILGYALLMLKEEVDADVVQQNI
jgi:hypothetical protein